MAETIQVLKAMWTQAEPTFHGQYYAIEKAYNNPRPVQQPRRRSMLGGSGSGLLKIAAAEADILNIIPPIFNGKDFVNDPVATVAFDTGSTQTADWHVSTNMSVKSAVTRRASSWRDAHAVCVRYGRRSRVRRIASRLGFPDVETARHSPLLCMGTPDEVRRDLTSRIEDLGMTYFILIAASADTQALFVKNVMPEFVSPLEPICHTSAD